MPKGIPKNGINKGWFKKGRTVPESERKKISENHPKFWFGKKRENLHSEEYKKNLSKKMKGEGNPFYGKKHTEKTKKKISLKSKENYKNNKQFIALQFKKGQFAKENHPNWKGGITPLRTALYYSDKHKKWRESVFNRDNFICQDCGKKNCYLEAHHIKEFHKILKQNKIETIEQALKCKELWNINNGKTLCKDCHNKTKKGLPKKLPRCLISCPIYSGKDYIIERFINRIKELTYENYDILLVDNSKEIDFAKKVKSLGVNVVKLKYDENSKKRLVSSRNYIRDYVLKNDYDYFFSLECDVIPPKDIIEQLLAHDKKVVGGWYYICEEPNIRPCLAREWTLVDMKFTYKPISNDLAENKLIKVHLGSFGCSLIHRSVLEEIKFKAYPTMPHHDDTWFYFDCEKKGIDVFVDTDLLVPHFQDHKWSEIDKVNRLDDFEKMRLKEEETKYEVINI
jgi:hypothetical protein